jgi:arylsulfatase A-like enzyme
MLKRYSVLAVALACLGISCGERDTKLNVILIGIDTVRQDHLGCYGYDRGTTPNIDRLARRGILFENAVSPSPWTLPSFATVFTSLYPTQHGAVTPMTSMRTSFPTLAGLLKDQGYATGAIINAPYLGPRYNLSRGFDLYDMPPRKGRIADGTTADALKWMDLNKDRPFFIFVHYFDPHTPYEPPSPYDTLFASGYSGPIGNSFEPVRLASSRGSRFEGMEALTPADAKRIESLYDGEIAFMDKAIGDLLRGVDDLGLREKSLIVLLSDHGEEFFDHGGFEHGHTLYEELIRVPLMMSLPGVIPEGVGVRQQVRLLDVAPTVLDLLDMAERPGLQGVSLGPLIKGNQRHESRSGPLLGPRFAYSEALLYGYENKSVSSYPWKLICDLATGEESFFNLELDPQELRASQSVPYKPQRELRRALYETVFSMSDTWYVEVAGGDRDHVFNIQMDFGTGDTPVRLTLHKVFDSSGNIFSTEEAANTLVGPSELRVRRLRSADPVRLAFILSRSEAPVRFYLTIDGDPATGRTFVGRQLAPAPAMPFTQAPSHGQDSSMDAPATRPEPPYVVIWNERAGFMSDTRIKLDEATREELRSLGYIQ